MLTGPHPERMAEIFTVAIRQPGGGGSAAWHVDLATGALTGDGADADWAIVGTAHDWAEVLAGRLNLSVALRRNGVRYCDFGENDIHVTEARIGLLAGLLELPYLSVSPAQATVLAG
jgi:hypothetical protein